MSDVGTEICQREGCGHTFDDHVLDPQTQRFSCKPGCTCRVFTDMSEADMKAWADSPEGQEMLKDFKIC